MKMNNFEDAYKRYTFLLKKMNREGLSEKEWFEKCQLKITINSIYGVYNGNH